jgi:GNAT superfamily N-acetyltransferase
MGPLRKEPHTGYVYLYYLAAPHRNGGLGRALDEYATAFLRGLGLRAARLNASPTNRQAMRFYEKNGWVDLGPSASHPEVHVLEKRLHGVPAGRRDA